MKVVACLAIFSVVTWLLATLSLKLLHLRGPAIGRMVFVILSALLGGAVCVAIEVGLFGMPAPHKDDPDNLIWFVTFYFQGMMFGTLLGALTCPFVRGR